MIRNIQTRAQKRLAEHQKKQQTKAGKTSYTNTDSQNDQKQDNPHPPNHPPKTYHKLPNQSQCSTVKPLSIPSTANSTHPCTTHPKKPSARFTRIRSRIFTTYSKIQLCYSLAMESLFLAFDIFDLYTDGMVGGSGSGDGMVGGMGDGNGDLEEQIGLVGLAGFMIAVKYEEVYPPTLNQVISKMKLYVNIKQYIQLQLKILKKLDYNLAIPSPIQHIQSLSPALPPQKKSFLYLNLQLLSLNPSIRKTYSWHQIMKALQFLLLPLNQIEKEQSKVEPRIEQCFALIMDERRKLGDLYCWVERKYSDSRFHFMALRGCYMGEEVGGE